MAIERLAATKATLFRTPAPARGHRRVTVPASTVDLSAAGLVEPLDSYVNMDPALNWTDVHKFVRTSAAVFNGSVRLCAA